MKQPGIFLLLFTLLFLLSDLALSSDSANMDNGLHIHDPWIREAPPNAKVLAAYMVLENHGNKNRIITKISSPDFNKIEIHVSKMENGSMTMQQRKRIVVHANKRFVLQPGDYHLMLFNPTKPMKHGDKIPFTFTLDNGQTIKTAVKVKRVLGSMGNKQKPGTKPGEHSDGHKHSHEH